MSCAEAEEGDAGALAVGPRCCGRDIGGLCDILLFFCRVVFGLRSASIRLQMCRIHIKVVEEVGNEGRRLLSRPFRLSILIPRPHSPFLPSAIDSSVLPRSFPIPPHRLHSQASSNNSAGLATMPFSDETKDRFNAAIGCVVVSHYLHIPHLRPPPPLSSLSILCKTSFLTA